MPAVDKKWFDDRLRDMSMSQRELSRAIGRDASSVSLLLTGKRRMTAETAADLARVLGATMEEVMVHAGVRGVSTSGADRVPLVGHVDGTSRVTMTPEATGSTLSPCALPPGAVALAMRTAQTPLEWMHGWVAFAAPQQAPDESLVDRTAIIQAPGDCSPVLRLVRRGSQPGEYMLTGFGLDPVYDVPIEWARRVLMFRPL